jgi:cytochrome c oxidase subunit 2
MSLLRQTLLLKTVSYPKGMLTLIRNLAGFFLACLISVPVLANNMPLDMPVGVTRISEDIYSLHSLMLKICIVIAIVVFGVMFYSIFKHRKSKGQKPAHFHEHLGVEILWTIIPFVILIAMAVPATKTLIAMNDTSDSQLTIKITGSQWKWHYQYLTYEDQKDLNFGFLSLLSTPRDQFETPTFTKGLFPHGLAASDNKTSPTEKNEQYLLEVDKPLVIPSDKKVRFLITSDDVIHAWSVPDFGLKRDAIPGYINEIWTKVPLGKEGTYRGQCSELCGKDHGFMPIVVEVKTPEAFNAWVEEQKILAAKEAEDAANSANVVMTQDELMKLGEEVYLSKCAMCHQASGQGMPPTFPGLDGSSLITKQPAADHIDIVVHGKNAMPKFDGIISLKEMAAVITYERNAWSNKTGDLIQPSDIAKHKQSAP